MMGKQISFTLDDNDLESCVNELMKNNVSKKEFMKTQSGLGKISIVGTGIQNQPGYASRMFKTLSENKINIEMITTSEIRITCIIKSSDLELAENRCIKNLLHDFFNFIINFLEYL